MTSKMDQELVVSYVRNKIETYMPHKGLEYPAIPIVNPYKLLEFKVDTIGLETLGSYDESNMSFYFGVEMTEIGKQENYTGKPRVFEGVFKRQTVVIILR